MHADVHLGWGVLNSNRDDLLKNFEVVLVNLDLFVHQGKDAHIKFGVRAIAYAGWISKLFLIFLDLSFLLLALLASLHLLLP